MNPSDGLRRGVSCHLAYGPRAEINSRSRALVPPATARARPDPAIGPPLLSSPIRIFPTRSGEPSPRRLHATDYLIYLSSRLPRRRARPILGCAPHPIYLFALSAPEPSKP